MADSTSFFMEMIFINFLSIDQFVSILSFAGRKVKENPLLRILTKSTDAAASVLFYRVLFNV